MFRSNHPIRRSVSRTLALSSSVLDVILADLCSLSRRRLLQLLIDLKSGGDGEGVKDTGVVPSSTPAPVRTVDKFTDDEKTFFRSCRILIAEGKAPLRARRIRATGPTVP